MKFLHSTRSLAFCCVFLSYPIALSNVSLTHFGIWTKTRFPILEKIGHGFAGFTRIFYENRYLLKK